MPTKELTRREQAVKNNTAIEAALRKAGKKGLTRTDLQSRLKDLTESQAIRGLEILRDTGAVKREGSRRDSRYIYSRV